MPRGIAYRRHQKARMKAHAQHVLNCVWIGSINPDIAIQWPAYKYTDNLKKCSCPMCNSGDPADRAMVKRADAALAWELDQLEKGD